MSDSNAVTQKIEYSLTPHELNTRASQLISEIHQQTFGNLPLILSRIIESKSWQEMPTPFKNFGEYAFSQSVDGLAIDSNQKLFFLKSSMDTEYKHIIEWKDVLTVLEKMIKTKPISERGKINNSCLSLERLSKSEEFKDKITYYPSRTSGGDSKIIRLSKTKNDYLNKIASGKITKKKALLEAGLINKENMPYNRATSAFKALSESQRKDFIKWLTSNNYLT